jgi:protein-S-isoprenylcysteine O-methyltransferase Ste14
MFAIALTISAYHRRKAARAGNERVSRREEGRPIMILLRLAGLSLWLSTLVYVINPDWLRWATLPLPVELRWLGAALSAIALPLIFWMFSSLGDNVTDTVAIRQKHSLVTHGPYRWIRHPLYSFGALFFVGIMLLMANGFVIAIGGVALSLLLLRTPIEEAKLIEKFGDEYRAYMQRTGRFLPRWSRSTGGTR